jgi:signal peptidase
MALIDFKCKDCGKEFFEIINEQEHQFITRGDANRVNDSDPVSADEILGKVVFHIPYIGYALSFARTKKGMAILILIPGLLLLSSQIIQLYKLAKANSKNAAQE